MVTENLLETVRSRSPDGVTLGIGPLEFQSQPRAREIRSKASFGRFRHTILKAALGTSASLTPQASSGVSTADIFSTLQAIALMEKIARQEMPPSMAYDWTELTYLQLQAENVAIYVFILAVVFVFLVLAAQYESWSLPLAVILVVPMCLLCSITGVILSH